MTIQFPKKFATIVTLNRHHDRIPDLVCWFLIRVPFFVAVRERKAALQKTKNYIKTKIEAMLQNGLRNPPETLVEAYALDMVDKNGLDLRPLIVLIHELFFAGTETTSTSLQWVFACMAAHLEIQERVFEEIDSVVGSVKLTSNFFKELPYFTAVQHEIQRFGSIAQGTVPHVMLNDVTAETGHLVKRGEIVQGSVSWILQDSKHWKNASSFSLENFLDEDGNFHGHDPFIPYGAGPRICLGNQLADLELKVFMFEIMRNLKIVADEPVDLHKKVQKITCSPESYKYRLIVR